MGTLSDELRRIGFTPTGEESPIDDDGMLWSSGHEIVCDETATVIDGNHHVEESIDDKEEVETRCGEIVYRYRNSEKVKLIGGYIGSYDWGDDDGHFRY